MDDRIFTLAEARAMLAQVEQLLAGLQDRRKQLDQAQALVAALRRSAGSNGGSAHGDSRELQTRARELIAAIREAVEEIQALGVQVKDVERGLVDWPALREGRTVLLCWQRGEASVDWWHEIADGFPGRRRVIPAEWE